MEHRLHNPAVGVTANDDVLYFQHTHGVLDSRRHATVNLAVGRHHVPGRIPANKDIARVRLRN